MMLQRVQKVHDDAISVLANNKEVGIRQEPSSANLPSIDVLSRFKSAKIKQKYNLDSKCLFECGPIKSTKLSLPYFVNGVSAGYPTNVDDPYMRHLDLTKYLIRYPKTTYYFKASGFSMVKAGILWSKLGLVIWIFWS